MATEETKDATFEIIKKGCLEFTSLDVAGHLSSYKDLLVAQTEAPMSVGFWKPQGVGDLLFDFPCSEAMLVIEGKVAFKDQHGDIYRAESGDLLIFYAPVKVTFLAESSGTVFTAMHGTPY